jgi:hypothetical protein
LDDFLCFKDVLIHWVHPKRNRNYLGSSAKDGGQVL